MTEEERIFEGKLFASETPELIEKKLARVIRSITEKDAIENIFPDMYV